MCFVFLCQVMNIVQFIVDIIANSILNLTMQHSVQACPFMCYSVPTANISPLIRSQSSCIWHHVVWNISKKPTSYEMLVPISQNACHDTIKDHNCNICHSKNLRSNVVNSVFKEKYKNESHVNLAKETLHLPPTKVSWIQTHGTSAITGHDCVTQVLISKPSYPQQTRFSHAVLKLQQQTIH